MCKKLFYLSSVLLVLTLASPGFALVLGDFEDGSMDGWTSPGTATFGTVGATTGSACVDVTGGGYWGLSWEAPYLLDLTTATTISFDVSMRVSDFPDGTWTNPGQALAINSDLGWREFAPSERIDRNTGGPYGGTDWGTWSGDQDLTIVYDISGADWTGILSSSFLSISIALNDTSGAGIFHVDNIRIEGATVVPFPETVPFSLGAVEDIEIANDEKTGPDSNSDGSGLNARELDIRRRVFFISYDISGLKGRNASQISLSHFSHDQNAKCNVYGVIEEMDLLEVESLTWNTAPGLQNDPTPPIGTPVNSSLDMNDLTDILLTFEGPGEKGIRFSTDTSDALADFINSDTDGILTLLFVADPETEGGDGMLVRSSEHSEGGTFLEGEADPVANIIWVSDRVAFKANDPNQVTDGGFVELLRDAGYAVDYKGEIDSYTLDDNNDVVALTDEFQYWRELDDDKIAELEAADLIIISRNASSGAYDDSDSSTGYDERLLWNGITTPMISMSAHLARVGYNKWGWFDTSGTPYTQDNLMTVLDPTHAIFAGVVLDANDQISLHTSDWTVEGSGAADAGNGLLLATRPADGAIMIATWEAGQQYNANTEYIAGGPRMFFAGGAGSKSGELYGAHGDGDYNLTADGQTVFLSAVEYMLPLSMVAHWPMDEGAGTVVADVAGGNDGAIVGNVAWLADGGVSFDNVDGNHIEVPNADVLDFGDVDFSISMMVRYPTPPVDTDRWIIKGTHGDPGTGSRYEIFHTSGATVRFTIDNGPDNVKSKLEVDDTAIVTGDWVHVVAVRDATNDLMVFYADGVLLGVLNETSGDISSGEVMFIGESTDETETAMSGDMKDIRIYDFALTADDIASIY